MVYSSSINEGDSTNKSTTVTNDNIPAASDHLRKEDDWQNKNGNSESPFATTVPISTSPLKSMTSSAEDEIWACTWTVWMRIATSATTTTEIDHSPNPTPTPTSTTSNNSSSTMTAEERWRRECQQQQQSLQHKQQFLTALLQIFPLIFTRIKIR